MNFYKRLKLKDFLHSIDKLVRCKIGEGHISERFVRNGKMFGFIVVISSISGPQTALPGYSHYTASKGGVAGFVKTAAVELAIPK